MRHPVHTALAEAAYSGRELTTEELDELQLDSADRELVRKAARTAAFEWAGGNRGGAHEYALRRSHEIIGGLPGELRSPRYLEERPDLRGLSPTELAARIPN